MIAPVFYDGLVESDWDSNNQRVILRHVLKVLPLLNLLCANNKSCQFEGSRNSFVERSVVMTSKCVVRRVATDVSKGHDALVS